MVTVMQPPVIEETLESSQTQPPIDYFSGLPESFQKVLDENPHLRAYIGQLPLAEIGMPEYCPELTRKMGDNKKPNLIYPAHKAGVFIHILFNKSFERNFYIPI